MDSEAVTKDDIIEDCSEGEDDAITRDASRKSLPSTTLTGRFESYLGAKQPESSEQADITEEQVDADADTLLDPSLLEDVHFNDDGTLTGGPAMAEMEEEEEEPDAPKPAEGARAKKNFLRQARAAADFVEEAHGVPGAAEESDGGSDAEEADGAVAAAEEAPLPDEHWKNRPQAEREMWERVRPRALRREALRVRDLKLPKACMDRLMKLHPEMQSKTSEVSEIVNCATVLLLQAMAQATVRGRKAKGQTVQLEDVRQACLNNQELSFMQPLSATLDASTLSAVARQDLDEEGVTTRSAVVTAAAPGQSTLSSAVFARTTAPMDAEFANGEDAFDVVTVQGNLEQTEKTPEDKQGSKRKLPQSGKKNASKAPRQDKAAVEAKPVGGGIAGFFKRSETA